MSIASPSARFTSAVSRNLAELQKAILFQITLNGLAALPPNSSEFLRVCRIALFDGYLAHIIKVLDKNTQSSTFWYVYQKCPGPIDDYLRSHGLSLTAVHDMAARLKTVRDKTHFHIDAAAVTDPGAVWKAVGINGRALAEVIDLLWKVLSHLQAEIGEPSIDLPASYTPAEVARTAGKVLPQT